MFENIKKLFCNHKYIMYSKTKPYYISCGDEWQDRKSREYYMVCSKCGKSISVIKDWSSIDTDKQDYWE